MIQLKIKRVYAPSEASDGLRVLIDRLWPRGLRKDALHYDLWAKDLAPSPTLRSWFHADPEGRWDEFGRRYRAELDASEQARDIISTLRGEPVVTLLYAAKDPERNHALILCRYLTEALG